MKKGLFLLRRNLISAGFFAGLILFWLPAHEVFEGPKAMGFLIYSAALAALSFPLLRTLPARFQNHRSFLTASGLLLGATLLSFLGAWLALPANLLLSVEKLAPMLAACLTALAFLLEEEETRRRVLFNFAGAHALLVFYGLIQVLDQNVAKAMGIRFDMIAWTSFGESRVYSSLGNPDYMAAQLTLFLPLWLGLGWARPGWNPKGALKAAAVLMALIPLPLIALVYGLNAPIISKMMESYWAWTLVCGALYILFWKASARTAVLTFAYMLVFLIFAAQGRGAYLGLAASAALAAFLLWKRQGFGDQRGFLKKNAIAFGIFLALFLGLSGLRAKSPQHPLVQLRIVQSAFKVSDSLQYRVKHLFDSRSDSTVVRLFYYKAALLMGLKHPVFGVGFGMHAMHTARMQSLVWKEWAKEDDAAGPSHRRLSTLVDPHVELYTHNDFIQNFAETGMVGLLAFLYFWYVFLRGAWRLPDSRLGLGLLGLATAFIVSAMVNFPWRVLASQQTVWLAMALLAVESAPPAPREDTRPQATHWTLAAAILAFILALYPARWFFSSSLFKQGNNGRDIQNWIYGDVFYSAAEKCGLSGTQRVELLLYLGSMKNSINKPEEAEKWFKRGVEIYPDFIEALYNLGYTATARFNKTTSEADRIEAVNYFNRVLDINPRYMAALNNLGNLHYAVRDFPKAISAYETLLKYNPETIEARYNLAASYLLVGRTDDAKVQLQEALKINPQYAPALQLYNQVKNLAKGTVVKFN